MALIANAFFGQRASPARRPIEDPRLSLGHRGSTAEDVGRMDVRLVTDGEVEERDLVELPKLLKGEAGFVWVDIPAGDEDAVHVLSEVFRFHPMAVNDAV